MRSRLISQTIPPSARSPRFALVMALLLAASPALAQSSDEAADSVPEYEYEAETREIAPPRRPIEDVAGFAEAIDATESTAEVTTVGELLSRSPGVRTRRLGGLDDFATVSVRGASANQVLVLLDGVPLNTAQLQLVNVNLVSPDLLDRVEVYRSGAPIWLGMAPMGGVINLVTREVDETAVVASASLGSYTTRKLTLMAATPLMLEPHWDLLIGGTYRGTEGDFLFHDDRGTPFNAQDDELVPRLNNAGNGGDLLLRSTVEPVTNLEISLQQALQIDRRGVPGLGQNQSLAARYEHLRSITQLQLLARAWPDPSADARLRLYADVLRDRFDDPAGDIGVGQRDVRTEGEAFGGQARVSVFAGPMLDLDAILDGRWEGFVSRNVLSTAAEGSEAQRWTAAPALQMGLHLADDRLLIAPAGRVELVGSDFVADSPLAIRTETIEAERADTLWTAQLGVRYRVLDAPVELSLIGNVIRSERLPTFLEMFGNAGSVVGNPTLAPEAVIGGDLGATLLIPGRVARGQLTLAGFAYRYDDLIQFVQNSQRVARPENIGRARVAGVEAALTLDLQAWLSWYASYTYTDAVDESGVAGQGGRPLPGRPAHDLYTALTGRYWDLELKYELDIESENTLDRAGFRVVPERVFHAVALRYRPGRAWTLGIEVNNLTDLRVEQVPLRPSPPGVDQSATQAVSDYLGFPLPGRTVYGTVRWEL